MSPRRRSRIRLAVFAVMALILLAQGSIGLRVTNAQSGITRLEGQSLTRLPDGRWLRTGGVQSSGQWQARATVVDANGVESDAGWRLAEPRAWHTTTVLPDGRLLVVGGLTTNGHASQTAELIDPSTGGSESVEAPTEFQRSRHTTTLLTDGSVLIVGGLSADGKWADTFRWQIETNSVVLWNVDAARRRYGHEAVLGPDGDVWVRGGTGPDRGASRVDRYRVDRETVQTNARPERDYETAIAEALPADGAIDVPIAERPAIRFTTPVDVETLNVSTVTLRGQEGFVPTMVIAAEGGRLLFVTPARWLAAGSDYALTIQGARDFRGALLDIPPIRFRTVGERPGSLDTDRSEDGDKSALDSPWRKLPPLESPGGTALAGQVLKMNGQPLADVTLSIDKRKTSTDHTGRFILTSLEPGHHELVIEGKTANRRDATYGRFEVGVDLLADKRSVLPYTIWMPKLDTRHVIRLASPTTAETIVTTPTLPGLELRLPAGTVIEDEDEQVVREITITPVPIDRPPFPLPNVRVPIYFTIQPGGAYLRMPKGSKARLVYPNLVAAGVGTVFDFWNYNANGRGWYVYGEGSVVPPGRQIVPNPGVGIYSFSGAMVADPDFAPPDGPRPGDESRDGDPVDLGTGLFVMNKTDITVADVMSIRLDRTYRQNDTRSRAFGIGMTHAYDIFLVGDRHPYTYADLILPDGGRVHFTRISPGTDFIDAVYEQTTTPSQFYKSRIAYVPSLSALGFPRDASFTFPGGWEVTLTDGTRLYFVDSENANSPQAAGLVGISDRNGNRLLVYREYTKGATKISTPNGRSVTFTHDASKRITQAVDNIGRVTAYAYDSNGRLVTVTDPDGGTTQYTYDSSHRMLTVRDRRNTVSLTNEYDTAGRVVRQTQADATTYQFAYTVDVSGRITQTDVTDPGGRVRRLQFNADGYKTSDTRAVGLPEQQTTTYSRQTGSNFATSITDPLGRQTTSNFDGLGHATSIQQLAGTPNAVTTSFTYTPSFGDLASVTDPLGHTTTYAWDSARRLVQKTDPLGHTTAFNYNDAGQVTSVTTALGAVTHFGYSHGDLVTVTNQLGASVSLGVDAVGRPVAFRDALGYETRNEYSLLDQVTRLTDALGGQTTFAYDLNGNVLSVTDALSSTTSYSYDTSDRMVGRADPLQHTATSQYNGLNQLIQRIDRKGQITAYQYDAVDRLSQVTFDDASTITYTYDAGSRLTQIADSANGTITRQYDLFDRLTREATPEGTIDYTYDAAGRRTTMTVAGQPQVSYGYDATNRLTTITQGTSIVSLSYDDVGRRSTLTYPNGIVGTYVYDAASQLTSLSYSLGSAVLGDVTYTYDVMGRRTSVGGSWGRTGLPKALVSATYDTGNRIASWGGTAFGYDLNGNLTSDGVTAYTWNARNQLSSSTGSTNASFQYDAVGRRREKAIGALTTRLLHDELNPIQELSAGGTPTANLLAGLAIDETFTRTDVAGMFARLVDALGSTLALADASGAAQTQYTFEPFGLTMASGLATKNPAQFTGRENDENGIYYYRARYYDPKVAKFLTEDPLGFNSGASNYYAYVNDSPVNAVDPLGLYAAALGPTASAGIALVTGGGQVGGSCSLAVDGTGGAGLLCCGSVGYTMGFGAGAGVGATGMFCPKCSSICDLEGESAQVELNLPTTGASGGFGQQGGGQNFGTGSITGRGGIGGYAAVGISRCKLVFSNRNCKKCK